MAPRDREPDDRRPDDTLLFGYFGERKDMADPMVHRGVSIRRSSTTVMNSGTATLVEKFHARVYSTKDSKKTIPIEADSLEKIKREIDAILDFQP